jgi:hypothetical protein
MPFALRHPAFPAPRNKGTGAGARRDSGRTSYRTAGTSSDHHPWQFQRFRTSGFRRDICLHHVNEPQGGLG